MHSQIGVKRKIFVVMAGLVYHIISQQAWDAVGDSYAADSLKTEGFIHFSTRHQVANVANTFYAGQKGLVLLEIDPAKLKHQMKYEAAAHPPPKHVDPAHSLFPHLYGELNKDAVVRVIPFAPGDDGLFKSIV